MQLPKSADLRRILIAQLPADFADWLDYIAILTLMTYIWRVDPIYFAWFALFLAVPYVIIGPIAGAMVDRWELKKVMILSNLGRAVTTAALIFAPDINYILALVFLRGAVDAFYSPAKQVAFQALADKDELMATNSLSFIINQVSKVIGPAVGGALLLWLAPQQVFFANAILSVLAAAILLGLPAKVRKLEASDKDDTMEKKRSLLADIGEGFQEIGSKPILAGALLLGSVGFFAMFLYDTMIGLAVRDLGFTQEIFGTSIAFVGAGGVLGALLLGNIKREVHPFHYFGGAMLIVGPVGAFFGYAVIAQLTINPILFLSIFAVVGFVGAGMFVPQRTVLQRETAPDKMGRVASVNEGLSLLAIAISPFVGALIARTYGLGYAFYLGGGIIFVTGMLALILSISIKPSATSQTENDATPQ